jgi:hypothetical protein
MGNTNETPYPDPVQPQRPRRSHKANRTPVVEKNTNFPVSYSSQRATSLTPQFVHNPLAEEEENECPPSFLCPITQEIMKEPVLVVESGMVVLVVEFFLIFQTYEKQAIETWFKASSLDPMTSQQLSSTQFVLVLSLKNAISEWRDIRERRAKA